MGSSMSLKRGFRDSKHKPARIKRVEVEEKKVPEDPEQTTKPTNPGCELFELADHPHPRHYGSSRRIWVPGCQGATVDVRGCWRRVGR